MPYNEWRCAAALPMKCGPGRRASLKCAPERAARGRFPNRAVGTNAWFYESDRQGHAA